MKKHCTRLLILMMLLFSCGFDLIFMQEWDLTPTPDPAVPAETLRTGRKHFSFLKRLFGADKADPQKLSAAPLSSAALLAGILCVLLLLAALSYFLIRRKTKNSQTS